MRASTPGASGLIRRLAVWHKSSTNVRSGRVAGRDCAAAQVNGAAVFCVAVRGR